MKITIAIEKTNRSPSIHDSRDCRENLGLFIVHLIICTIIIYYYHPKRELEIMNLQIIGGFFLNIF